LLVEANERGWQTAYFKPMGTAPSGSGADAADPDATYLSTLTSAEVPVSSVCPVVRTTGLIEATLTGGAATLVPRVTDAYRDVSLRAGLVFVEGPSDLTQGRAFGLDLARLSSLLCGHVLLIDRLGPADIPDDVLLARDSLGDALFGVILNDVPSERISAVNDTLVPYLGEQGVRVLGVLEHDALLSSVTVADMVAGLDGRVLSGADALDRPVESFMVGAMGREKALRYFRRRDHKAVVTGGDRTDVQLAALDTDTAAIVCTGGTTPALSVLTQAERIGVPVIVADMDTLTAVTRLESVFGRVQVHDPGKVARIREMLRAAVDLDAMFTALTAQAS
jgi:BioD-like phosphotransacetylase family protein